MDSGFLWRLSRERFLKVFSINSITVAAERKGFKWYSFLKSIPVAAERGKVLELFPFRILLKPLKPARAQGSQIKEGFKKTATIKGPGICWTTPLAEMILDWIHKALEKGFQ